MRSAQRLRRHPLAGDFRAAWDAALAQVWAGLEQVALDRVMNEAKETIERDGFVVVERRRPCSERLLIHLLNARERAQAAARAERAEAHARAMAEYRLAEIRARVEAEGRRGGKAREAVAPPVAPVPVSDAAAETSALQAFHGLAERFGEWPAMEEAYSLFGLPAGESLEPIVAAAAARQAARLAASGEPADEGELSPAFAERLRWEHFPVDKPVRVSRRA